ncbi:hypothetical protein Vi05172_g5606 [Venturia inaequalis]|nr:hypothetical protein Vi05172_g5606 [Venturia inaequalis]
MYLQTLLPAILFAQSTLAYACCVQSRSKQGTPIKKASSILFSGPNQPWHPDPNTECEVTVYKTGTSCATWNGQVAYGCGVFQPIASIGSVDAKECGY